MRSACEHLGEAETLNRVGGEEFVIVARDTKTCDAVALVVRLRTAIGSIDQSDFSVSASFGVASCGPTVTMTAALIDADDAMCRAKAAGRDRVVVDAPWIDPTASGSEHATGRDVFPASTYVSERALMTSSLAADS